MTSHMWQIPLTFATQRMKPDRNWLYRTITAAINTGSFVEQSHHEDAPCSQQRKQRGMGTETAFCSTLCNPQTQAKIYKKLHELELERGLSA